MSSNEVEVCKRIPGIKVAVQIVGGQEEMARALGVKQQAVSLWVLRGYAPEKHVDQISNITGVPTSVLMRPDTVLRARDIKVQTTVEA